MDTVYTAKWMNTQTYYDKRTIFMITLAKKEKKKNLGTQQWILLWYNDNLETKWSWLMIVVIIIMSDNGGDIAH